MKKISIFLLMMALLPSCLMAQRIQQKLERSVVAASRDGKVLVSWRKLAQEPENCTYNLYKRSKGATEYTKVNSSPITKTNYSTSLSSNTEVAVSMVVNGVEGEKSAPYLYKTQAYNNVYFDFNFETKILNPNDYKCKYAWPMDLDGNGEFDAVLVDRISNDFANTSHKLQAYTLDGTCLWTVDAGPNVDICAGQNDAVLAYDINCDGKCEVIMKTSDGSRFWDKANNTWGKYANGSSKADTDGDGIVDYRPSSKNPPFYISVIDGKTGEEIDCNELKYNEIKDRTDQYSRNNRGDYYNDNNGTEYAFLGAKFAICYFDGVHPSLAVECYNRRNSDGHHYYMLSWTYDWTSGKAANWHHDKTWARSYGTPHCAEFHQVRVADTDGDGIDEILEGGFGWNPVKGLVYSAGIGHGDRFDVTDIDPERPGMEVFAIQQSALMGQVLYDARTGEHIKEWYLPSVVDVGRGRCMDVDASRKGWEMFSLLGGLYDCKGEIIKEGETAYPHESSWWDGDLQRELIGSPGGSGYGSNAMIVKYNGSRLCEFSKESSWATHTGWANRPAFMGDITGDWREEVILAKQNADTSTGLVGYTTNIATDYSFYTLQEDPHYRLDCTGRGYYQSPCPSFYLGGDMPYPPLPPTMMADYRWKSGAAWSVNGSGFASYDMTTAQNYVDGKSLVFDISGDNSQTITINGTLKPKTVYMMVPRGHDYTFSGTGSLAGDMELWKSMLGNVTFNNNLDYTGLTVVSEGILCVNGTIAGPLSLRAKGTLSGNVTVKGNVDFEGALNYEGCRLMPVGTDGVMTFAKDLVVTGDVYLEISAADGKCGKLVVDGNLTLENTNYLAVNHTDLAEGDYVIAECTGKLTADVTKIITKGLTGVNYKLVNDGKKLVLSVSKSRAPMTGVMWTGNETNAWDYKALNFEYAGAPTNFVVDDVVVFNDKSGNRNITINDMVVTKGVTFDFNTGTYNLSGNGGISGSGDVVKKGKGEVVVDLKNSDYTGKTIINEGTLTITNIDNSGRPSALGASNDADGIQLAGGTLKINATNMSTDRVINLVSDTSTINVFKQGGSLSLKSITKGNGYLVKDGMGQLNFTYGGANTFPGIIVKKGVVAQGAWNATFCKTGGNMTLAGGEVHLINMNNSSTRPIFNYVTEVQEGTKSLVKGTTRGAINGSFKGKGELTIISDGVRNDIGANFSAFEGTLNVQGANFRLQSNVTDMSKTNVVMTAGSFIGHYASNGSGQQAVTTSFGSLSSAAGANDCTLGHSQDSYTIGHNGMSTSFSGLFKAKSIQKVGNGVLTLKTSGSTSPIYVNGGTLQLYNEPFISSPGAVTSGSITVNSGAELTGIGCAYSIVVNKGGLLSAGYNGNVGTLKANGNVILNAGGTIQVKIGASSNDKFKIKGSIKHNGDTLLIVVDEARTLKAGDKITIFDGAGTQSGTYVLKTISPAQDIAWDDSEFLTTGVLKVASAETSGISGVISDDTEVNVYTTDGLLIRGKVKYGEALEGLQRGVYLINGRKVVK